MICTQFTLETVLALHDHETGTGNGTCQAAPGGTAVLVCVLGPVKQARYVSHMFHSEDVVLRAPKDNKGKGLNPRLLGMQRRWGLAADWQHAITCRESRFCICFGLPHFTNSFVILDCL